MVDWKPERAVYLKGKTKKKKKKNQGWESLLDWKLEMAV